MNLNNISNKDLGYLGNYIRILESDKMDIFDKMVNNDQDNRVAIKGRQPFEKIH